MLLRLLQEQPCAGAGQRCWWLAVQQGSVLLQRLGLPRIACELSCPGSSRQRVWINCRRRRSCQPQRRLQRTGAKACADCQPSAASQRVGSVRQRGRKRLAEQRGA